MRTPQHLLKALAIVACSSLVFVGGDSSLRANKKETVVTPGSTAEMPPVVHVQPAALPPPNTPSTKTGSVDQIRGIGRFQLGQNFNDFAPGLLQVVDSRASGVLLRVSPYGENYLVTDVSGMTWGNIPIAGMVLTFHAGVLIDIQVAMKAKNFDFYVADRAFKAKYGPNDPKASPVEIWKGKKIQMTLIFPGANLTDAKSIDTPTEGKIDLFDLGQWEKLEAARVAALKDNLEQRYQETAPKVQTDL